MNLLVVNVCQNHGPKASFIYCCASSLPSSRPRESADTDPPFILVHHLPASGPPNELTISSMVLTY